MCTCLASDGTISEGGTSSLMEENGFRNKFIYRHDLKKMKAGFLLYLLISLNEFRDKPLHEARLELSWDPL